MNKPNFMTLFQDDDKKSNTYGALRISTDGIEAANQKDEFGRWLYEPHGTIRDMVLVIGLIYGKNKEKRASDFSGKKAVQMNLSICTAILLLSMALVALVLVSC
ncbi:hypothetical protein [Frisingicoccus sp.]|uniref:hypothetical protein n=1 Tax=Frisingicoccus sp. TaxID=1918627 RepID=UPI0015BC78A2